MKRAQNISSLQKGKEGQATDNTNKKESTRKTSQRMDQASTRTGNTKQGKGCEVKAKGSDGSKQEGGYSRRVSQGAGRGLNGREGRAGSRFENRNAYEESFQERRYGIMDVGVGMGMPPLHMMPQAQGWAEMQGQMGQWMVPQPQEMMHPACFYPAGAGGYYPVYPPLPAHWPWPMALSNEMQMGYNAFPYPITPIPQDMSTFGGAPGAAVKDGGERKHNGGQPAADNRSPPLS